MAQSLRSPALSRTLLALALTLGLCRGPRGSAWITGAAPRLPRSRRVAMAGKAQDGMFTPAVGLLKEVMGESDFKKLRADVIKTHGSVMGSFIDTQDSVFGQWTLRKLFDAADKDGNGELDREELMAALPKLGFRWMEEEKAINQLIKKGDKDGNGLIDFEEFKKLAPIALKQNLLKLAKTNGAELGMLS